MDPVTLSCQLSGQLPLHSHPALRLNTVARWRKSHPTQCTRSHLLLESSLLSRALARSCPWCKPWNKADATSHVSAWIGPFPNHVGCASSVELVLVSWPSGAAVTIWTCETKRSPLSPPVLATFVVTEGPGYSVDSSSSLGQTAFCHLCCRGPAEPVYSVESSCFRQVMCRLLVWEMRLGLSGSQFLRFC